MGQLSDLKSGDVTTHERPLIISGLLEIKIKIFYPRKIKLNAFDSEGTEQHMINRESSVFKREWINQF